MSEKNAAVAAVVDRLLGDRRLGGFTPSYLADRYAEHENVSRGEAISALSACIESGALVTYALDGFPLVTTPDRLPASVFPPAESGGAS